MTDPSAAVRSIRRRAAALDVAAVLAALAGAAATVTALVLAMGLGLAALLVGGAGLTAAAVAVMRREHALPDRLVPRDLRTPADPADDTPPGEPYARARSIADGAPRSPISGM